jgi:hypothetical protein
MRTRYLTGNVTAKRQTDKALLCSLDWQEDHDVVASDLWIPLSVVHPEDHDTIEEAHDNEVIEISVAAWWVEQNF